MRALVFPGQGSQYVGMGSKWMDRPVFRRTLEEADEALGEKLSDIILEGPIEPLTLTRNTQPALLSVSVGYARILEEEGVEFGVVGGHSLGEYSALVAAGAIRFADGVRLTRLRGEAMQAATPAGTGGMAAVLGMRDEAKLAELCAAAAEGEVLEPAGFNTTGQFVVAGSIAAVDRAVAMARDFRCVAKKLNVSAPFHCSLLIPAGERLAVALAETEITTPAVPYAVNALGEVVEQATPEQIRQALVEQVSKPVRWTGCMRSMVALGATEFYECGPGRVITGLLKRFDRKLPITNFESVEH